MTCLQGLKAGQEGRIAVDRAYAGLQKTHFRISKTGHGLHKKVRRRQAVGIKDGNKVSPGFCQAKGEIACLVACAFWSAQMTDVSVREMSQSLVDDLAGLVCGIVQNKDFQLVVWIAQAGDCLEELGNHMFFVADRQKDRDPGPVGTGWESGAIRRGIHGLKVQKGLFAALAHGAQLQQGIEEKDAGQGGDEDFDNEEEHAKNREQAEGMTKE